MVLGEWEAGGVEGRAFRYWSDGKVNRIAASTRPAPGGGFAWRAVDCTGRDAGRGVVDTPGDAQAAADAVLSSSLVQFGRPLTDRLRGLLVAVHDSDSAMADVAARIDLPEGEELTTAHVREWFLIEAGVVARAIAHEVRDESSDLGGSMLPVSLRWAGHLAELLEELDRIDGIDRSTLAHPPVSPVPLDLGSSRAVVRPPIPSRPTGTVVIVDPSLPPRAPPPPPVWPPDHEPAEGFPQFARLVHPDGRREWVDPGALTPDRFLRIRQLREEGARLEPPANGRTDFVDLDRLTGPASGRVSLVGPEGGELAFDRGEPVSSGFVVEDTFAGLVEPDRPRTSGRPEDRDRY